MKFLSILTILSVLFMFSACQKEEPVSETEGDVTASITVVPTPSADMVAKINVE